MSDAPNPTTDRQIVLMFHGIGTPHAAIPGDERPYWIDWARFDGILGRFERPLRAGTMILTFDDGNASDLEAAERLARAGLTGKFFVLAGRIGLPHYLSACDLRRIDALGMEVGLHGRDHIDWRHADAAVLEAELVDARRALADILGKPVTSVAIPFGAYNGRVKARLQRDDFARVYTSDTGPARARDRFCRRNPVMADHDIAAIDAIFADRVPLARKVRRTVAPVVKRALR